MPNTKYLSLTIDGMLSEFPFFSLEDYFTGKEIYLCLFRCGVIMMSDARILASVEQLSVRCDRAVTCSLSSRTLTSLIIHEVHLPEEPLASSFALPMLDLSSLPSLQSISFYNNWIVWSKYSLSSLKKVSIWSGYGKFNLHNDVTSLLRDIARSPESYPSLEDVRTYLSPH
ncbi:hypothetical protein CPB86DRAFT_821111 [Serendipita vermifera]|nr:hypothetical protein CPB86DRAFT_821111 [Serendipita vermifera]